MIVPSSRYRNSSTVFLTQDGRVRQVIVPSKQASYSFQFTFHRVAQGDRVDTLAARYYGDERLWWHIADANPETLDWTVLSPGMVLRVPHV